MLSDCAHNCWPVFAVCLRLTCLKSKGFLVHIFYEIYSYCKGYEELVDLNIWLLRSADCCYGWKFVEPACKQFIA